MFSNDKPTQASEQLIELLGQPYDAKQIQAILEPLGVKTG